MSLFPWEYGASGVLIDKLRSLPAIEIADLERAAEVAYQHLYLLEIAAEMREAYQAREDHQGPYTELDFLIDAASVYLQLGEFVLPLHGWTALETVEALVASVNTRPIRVGLSCSHSAILVVWEMIEYLFLDFTPPHESPYTLLVSALMDAFPGPPRAGRRLLKNADRYGIDETRIRKAASAVNLEGLAKELAEQFADHLGGIDLEFLRAKIDIEVSRAAAFLHSLRPSIPVVVPTPSSSSPQLVIDEETVMLDGEIVLLDMTPERRKEVIFYLKTLLNAKGQRLSDSDVNRKAEEANLGEFMNIRWDQVRKLLPDKLSAMIDTHSRKGSCLVLSRPPRRRLRK
jgi:hypothetical protein